MKKRFKQLFKFGFVRFSKISDLSGKKSELGDLCFESVSLIMVDAELKPMGELAINFYKNKKGACYSQLIQYSYSYPLLQAMADVLLPILSDNDSATNPDYMIADLEDCGYIDLTNDYIENILKKYTEYK